MSVLSDPIFHDEQAAIAYVESILWPHGPVCPKCGVIDNAYQLKGKRARPGLRRCKDCKKDFTVKVGTIFEASHVTMCHWLQALYLLTASKKGFSAHQLHRTLGVTYKTAWFMFHCLREAMRNDGSVDFGAGGGVVEVDETVPIRLTHTPTTCSVAVIENSGTSDLEGIVEFECRIIHK